MKTADFMPILRDESSFDELYSGLRHDVMSQWRAWIGPLKTQGQFRSGHPWKSEGNGK
jgi:hypothetical protein